MKVLHVHPKIGIGGVETYLCRLIGEQVRLGHTVGLLTAGGVFEERVTAAGGRLFLIPPPQGAPGVRSGSDRPASLRSDSRPQLPRGAFCQGARRPRRRPLPDERSRAALVLAPPSLPRLE